MHFLVKACLCSCTLSLESYEHERMTQVRTFLLLSKDGLRVNHVAHRSFVVSSEKSHSWISLLVICNCLVFFTKYGIEIHFLLRSLLDLKRKLVVIRWLWMFKCKNLERCLLHALTLKLALVYELSPLILWLNKSFLLKIYWIRSNYQTFIE